MTRPLILLSRAIQAWWREFLFLLLLNFLWLLAQLTIVLGPPTTAALYAVAEQVLDGDLVGFGDLARAWREMWRAAWVWGLAQVIVYGVLGFNLLAYANSPGAGIFVLRYTWALLCLLWFALNLYYWPLYLAQEDRRFTTTLANAARMLLLNPGFTLVYALAAGLLIAVSVLFVIPVAIVLATWLALWGNLIVRDRLASVTPRR